MSVSGLGVITGAFHFMGFINPKNSAIIAASQRRRNRSDRKPDTQHSMGEIAAACCGPYSYFS